MADFNKTNEEPEKAWAGRVADGICIGEKMQTRFQRIPAKHLNKETVAGIRDMNLGRVKNGKPIGRPTIRFDTGKNSGANPHINIDPKGYPNAKNPHIEVPSGVIDKAQIINKTLKYGGITLTVAAIAIDTWRLISAFKDDVEILRNADNIIEELKDAIETLEKKLEAETDYKQKSNIKETLDHLKTVLRDVKRTKKVPVKFIKTASSIGGGWSGGAAAGMAGAWAGAQSGAFIGTLFGPVGTVIGAPIGAVVGAIGLGIGGGIAGSKTGEAIADLGLELAD